jgi:hypothetical protein
MDSLIPIDILRQEDIGTPHRSIAIMSNTFTVFSCAGQLRTTESHWSLDTRAIALFLNYADSDVVTGTAVPPPASRRSPRSHGMHRRNLFTDEVKAIFCGITGGTRAFRHDMELSSVQLLGMSTM